MHHATSNLSPRHAYVQQARTGPRTCRARRGTSAPSRASKVNDQHLRGSRPAEPPPGSGNLGPEILYVHDAPYCSASETDLLSEFYYTRSPSVLSRQIRGRALGQTSSSLARTSIPTRSEWQREGELAPALTWQWRACVRSRVGLQ